MEIIMGKFSYAAVDAAVRSDVQAAAGRIKAAVKRTAQDVLAIGRDLLAVKEKVGHGLFLAWLEGEFEMTRMTAWRFMEVAERFGAKGNSVLHLSPSVLYELASPSTSDEAVEAVVEQAKTRTVTVLDVKKVRTAKPRVAKPKLVTEAAPRRGRPSKTPNAALLPASIIKVTRRPDGGTCHRTRVALIALAEVARASGCTDVWDVWLGGYAEHFAKGTSNSDYIAVAQGFPIGHATATKFDRAYSKDEAEAFFASLQRANAGEPPLLEDRHENVRLAQRERERDAALRAGSEWTKKPEEWAPELAAEFGYGSDSYDRQKFLVAYSQKMGHVTTRTMSERELRKRLAAVEAMFNTLRSIVNVKLPLQEDLTAWVHAEGPKDNRKAHWLRRIAEHEWVLDQLKAMLNAVEPKWPAKNASAASPVRPSQVVTG